ncbi:MAG TPA: hypothetical protein VKB80_05205 [Kofleriaceae bacterium]|nr:hypothetical protein [Kofleriaceae bacterium]
MRRTSFACAALAGAGLAMAAAAATAVDSHANGRPPATTNVRFGPDTETIYLPVTFGLLKSNDGGGTFQWVCEVAIGYGGVFDPDYAVAPDGSIYATTFEGLRVSHSGGCNWEATKGLTEDMFVSEVEVGSDGRVWAATSTGGGPNNVYVSEDGANFVESNLPEEKAWWTTLRVAPGKPDVIYATGFLPQDTTTTEAALLRRSDDGGATWNELPLTDFQFGDHPTFYLEDVSPTDEKVVFLRVAGAVEPAGDALYRSEDAGETWTKVLEFSTSISAFHIRPDGQTVIAATIDACAGDPDPAAKGCVQISSKAGAEGSWAPAEQQPRLACIGERSDGVLYGCGANWEPDNFALGKSQDGQTWEKVFRFSETVGPLECEGDSAQAECAATTWPTLCVMFGICAGPDAGPMAQDGGGLSGDGDGGGGDGGCCRVGGGSDASWVPGLVVVLFGLAWRGRKRR